MAPELPAGTAITGYQIYRRLQDATQRVIEVMGSATHWTDPTEEPVDTVILYQVAARVGNLEGAPTSWEDVVSGGGVLAAAIGSQVEAKEVPVDPKPPVGYMGTTRSYGVIGWLEDVRTGFEDWIKIQIAQVTNRDPRGVRQAGQLTVGWVRLSQVTLTGSLADVPAPPYLRVTAPGLVPVRIGPSLGYTEYLAQLSNDGAWYEIIGENGGWWQLRLDAAREGWLPAGQVETTGDTTGVPFVNEAPPPELAVPGAAQASGHYRNLALSWLGAWAVSRVGL